MGLTQLSRFNIISSVRLFRKAIAVSCVPFFLLVSIPSRFRAAILLILVWSDLDLDRVMGLLGADKLFPGFSQKLLLALSRVNGCLGDKVGSGVDASVLFTCQRASTCLWCISFGGVSSFQS